MTHDMPERSPAQFPAPVPQSTLEELAVPGAIRVEVVDEYRVAVHIGSGRVEVYEAEPDGYVEAIPDPRLSVDVVRRIAAAYGQAVSLLVNRHVREAVVAERAQEWMNTEH